MAYFPRVGLVPNVFGTVTDLQPIFSSRRKGMSIWRSALSILGAFFVVVVLVGLATAVSSNLMLGGMGPDVEITVAYLVVNLAYSVLIAVIGGYIAATVSDHSPLGHAAGLAGFMMVLGLFSWLVVNRGDPAPGQPSWYPFVIGVLVPPVAILGGILVTRRTRTQTHFSRRVREAASKDS